MGKRAKGQDRDKYYRLAKDQGYRARSAFKLIEINKRYDFLSTAKVCIDLCAAPGGWCQVAAKFMPRGSIIIGVDLLPIRPIPNVKTLVHDITTDECRTALKREMQTAQADVVLCDGAPNVGTAYKKDAYEQNEIALHALRVATQHLCKGGTFVTKVYRSQDYNSLIWVIQQFFEEHQAVKPASSRSQSAEIFVVGRNYKAPEYIDPRMLDPKHAFQQDYDSQGGAKGITIFHKKYDQHNKRHRQGYDEDLGMMLSRITKVSAFIDADDPVRVLTNTHVLEFSPECQVYKEHRATDSEIQQLCSDLRVLGKGDFRQLVKWRLRMVAYRDELRALQTHGEEEEGAEEAEEADVEAPPKTDEEEEEEVQAEIKALQIQALAKRKRQRKKDREAAARLRTRVAMGMENCAIDLPEEEGVFSLATIKDREALEAVRNVDLAKLDHSELNTEADTPGTEAELSEDDEDDKDNGSESEDYDAAIEEEVDAAYLRFLQAKDEAKRQEGTRLEKRRKKAKADKASNEEKQDNMLYDEEQQRYLQLLANGGVEEPAVDASDIDSSDVASDGEGSDAERDSLDGDVSLSVCGVGSEHARSEADVSRSGEDGTSSERHPLLAEISTKSERRQAATQRWFDDPLFDCVEEHYAEDVADVSDPNADEGSQNGRQRKRPRRESGMIGRKPLPEMNAERRKAEGGFAAAVLESMPKTDKEKRREKRKKAAERKERKVIRNKRQMGEDGIPDDDLQVVSGEQQLENLDPKQRAKMEHKRGLIRAGMGGTADEPEKRGFEIAKASTAAQAMLGERKKPFEIDGLQIADDREYGSEQEGYDDEDRAKQLALGTMMLRKHRAKELVDAAYNRFSWNDDANLPDWFVDDEKRHHRPQVPLPPGLVEQMKQKFASLATKPIKKVAEARARKRKRATQRLAVAKKKATALASNPDMSEREKLKAIQQAMRKGAKADVPSKVYIVAGKGPTGAKKKGAKIKMVDSRMKSDTRGMKRAEEKRKKGVKGRRGRR